MEYNVFDLLKILLRKWYILLAAVLVVSPSALFLSQKSYENAVAEYERATTEMVSYPLEVGEMTVNYRYECEVSGGVDAMFEALAGLAPGVNLPEKGAFLEKLFNKKSTAIHSALASDSAAIIAAVQERVDELEIAELPSVDSNNNSIPSTGNLIVEAHVNFTASYDNVIRIKIFGLVEEMAQDLVEICAEEICAFYGDDLITLKFEEQSKEFKLTTPVPTANATLAEVVMMEPATAPNKVKVIGVAAALSFAFACFGVLAVTFVKDSLKASNVKKEDEQPQGEE